MPAGLTHSNAITFGTLLIKRFFNTFLQFFKKVCLENNVYICLPCTVTSVKDEEQRKTNRQFISLRFQTTSFVNTYEKIESLADRICLQPLPFVAISSFYRDKVLTIVSCNRIFLNLLKSSISPKSER